MFRALDSFLVLLDLQARILHPLPDALEILSRIQTLVEGAKSLQISTVATEQIPEKLGPTVDSILPFAQRTFPKHQFSAAQAEGFVTFLQESACRSVILAGIETHICILQTALELAQFGFKVGVVADATAAGSINDHEIALRRLNLKGIEILTVETILMEWTQSSQNPAFRSISGLVKAQRSRVAAKETLSKDTPK